MPFVEAAEKAASELLNSPVDEPGLAPPTSGSPSHSATLPTSANQPEVAEGGMQSQQA
jgi:hypothetical protein